MKEELFRLFSAWCHSETREFKLMAKWCIFSIEEVFSARNKVLFIWFRVMWWSAKNFSHEKSENFNFSIEVERGFWHFAYLMMFAIQHDVNNVTLFVALHFPFVFTFKLATFFSMFSLALSFLLLLQLAKPFNLSSPGNPFVSSLHSYRQWRTAKSTNSSSSRSFRFIAPHSPML